MPNIFEQNRDARRRSKRRRLVVSLAAALLLNLIVLMSLNLRTVRQVETQDLFLELDITDFVPEQDESPDIVVDDSRAYSTKSYNSQRDKVKYGTYGGLPSSPSVPQPYSPAEDAVEKLTDQSDLVEKTLWQLVRESTRESLREIYNQADDRRPGNDGDYKGESDENDFSVIKPEDKYISYLQKFRSKIQNVWRPDLIFPAGHVSRGDIYTVLQVEIKRDGTLRFIEISRSSGIAAFDSEAIRTVREAAPYSPFPPSWKDQSTFSFAFGFKLVGNSIIIM